MSQQHNFAVLSDYDTNRCCLSKIPYRSKTIARDAAAKLTKTIGRVLTPYKCQVCGEFHLTHHKPAAMPAIKNRLRKRANQEKQNADARA